jgi:hypothetical protein
MGRIGKRFPCGCIVDMATWGVEAGGHAIEPAYWSFTCSPEQREEHVKEAYKECSTLSTAELEIEKGWRSPPWSNDTWENNEHSEACWQEYHTIKRWRLKGKDWTLYGVNDDYGTDSENSE